MAYEVVRTPPQVSDFTDLSTHQEQTPGTFFGGQAVLHLQCANAKLRIAPDELALHTDFAALGDSTAHENGDIELGSIDVWVTSRHLILWSTIKSTGIQLPYPTITLHAQDRDAVLLQLSLSEPNMTADEDLESLQLRIVPNAAGTSHGTPSVDQAIPDGNGHITSPEQRLYDAISACQELNPDPNAEGDEDEEGAFDETAPGASGWITSESMGDFMDEDGNFRMPEGMTVFGAEEGDGTGELGTGAGTRRTAGEANGGDEDDGRGAEGKWQRTG
ncbi:hypothetical protein LTR62_001700 [Meristemomyces frigidus]|uniref:Regulator of volume decrease after cellular swelling-domain-containing protein n=1 Tax=Meristemomyces frigidus TaxID=1508187 RepID=A0AAN7T925_9PEZI|nr:hypothetical protein LTR62_001700 [Meristemomyces frigidus]